MNLIKKLAAVLLVTIIAIPAYCSVSRYSIEQIKGDGQSIIERTMRRNRIGDKGMRIKENVAADASETAMTWGVLYHENGTTWYYTQTFEERGWYFGASDIVVYDNNFTEVGSLHLEVPEDMNVNDIDPIDFVSTSFFDTDASSVEIPIFMHAVDNGTQISKMGIYHLDGTKILEYDSQALIEFRASDNYLRVLLMNEEDGNTNISILKGAQEGVEPVIEHTFSVDQDLLYYNNGPMLNYYSIDNEPYYVVSHFEKPCMDGIDMETFVPTQAPDNYLVVKTYDKTFAMVDSIKVSIAPSNPEATYGFASLGMLTNNDVRLGEFTNDNQFNYIITHYDYFALSDDFVYYFRVYDSEGNLVNTIVENTTTWFNVSDVKGCEEQMAFLKMNDKGEQLLEMIDIPSCNVAAVFPAMVDGYRISTTFDRYPVGDDYQYVFGLANAEVDANGDAIARIGWYNKDCSVDHYVTFNIGKNAEGFTPYIASYVLNPYLFNTDSEREYFYLAMNKRDDGSEVLDKTLYLADENGNVLLTIRPQEGDEIEFSSGDIFDYNTPSPALVLSFYNGATDMFDVMYYTLPFEQFTSGGDGTEANPYVVTTPGELAQMKMHPDAHYVLGNDIDMSGYNFTYYAPVSFTGSFDGNNYYIKNAVLCNTGLFGSLENASVKNVQIQSPILITSDGDNGIISSTAVGAIIEGVHIYDALIDGECGENMNIGGLLGTAKNSTITAVSMIRATVNNPVNNMGGIIGNMNECKINAAVAGGHIVMGGCHIGGIAADADATSSIVNSHTAWNIEAHSGIAGIVCNSHRANISYCYAKGYYNDMVDSSDWPTYAGIVYALDEAQDESSVYVISNCVTTNYDVVRTCADNERGLYNNYTGKTSDMDSNSHQGAYKAVEEMDRTFFEGLGYTYGNNNDAPWTGEGMPILYFENDRQNVVTIGNDSNTIHYDGNNVECNGANIITMYDLQGHIVSNVYGDILNVATIARGIYVVVAIDLDGNSTVRKIVVK